ncbi:hypothetical protein [Streptomyces sp. NPDC059063]|uniref:hypothetical protein n=1 Tax=unclassified Streptomyces TaxID=2593676 RepID=UPI0036BF5984
MATDGWQQVRDATVALWRQVRPERDASERDEPGRGDSGREEIRGELEALRAQVRAAAGDPDIVRVLEDRWQLRLQSLLWANPRSAAELRLLLDEQLAPVLDDGERDRVYAVLRTSTAHSGTGIAVGRDHYDGAQPSPKA